MNSQEVYKRIRKTLIVILILMIIFNFVAIISLHIKLEDNIKAVDILIEHIKSR